jgi:hypothetical protein
MRNSEVNIGLAIDEVFGQGYLRIKGTTGVD